METGASTPSFNMMTDQARNCFHRELTSRQRDSPLAPSIRSSVCCCSSARSVTGKITRVSPLATTRSEKSSCIRVRGTANTRATSSCRSTCVGAWLLRDGRCQSRNSCRGGSYRISPSPNVRSTAPPPVGSVRGGDSIVTVRERRGRAGVGGGLNNAAAASLIAAALSFFKIRSDRRGGGSSTDRARTVPPPVPLRRTLAAGPAVMFACTGLTLLPRRVGSAATCRGTSGTPMCANNGISPSGPLSRSLSSSSSFRKSKGINKRKGIEIFIKGRCTANTAASHFPSLSFPVDSPRRTAPDTRPRMPGSAAK